MSQLIGKAALLNFCKRKCEPHYISVLDADVNVRILSVGETMDFEQQSDGLSDFDSGLLYASYLIGDKDGARMFVDLADICKLPPAAVMQISEIGNQLNNISDDKVEAAAKK